MVEIKAPATLKDFEGKLGVSFKSLVAQFSKKELLDVEKMVVINLKREESIALMDRDDNLWELFRNNKGHYKLRRLKRKLAGT
jgi:hypothetical protein